MIDFDELKQTYYAECAEYFAELEDYFSALNAHGYDADIVNGVFRAVHSIKGGAAAFGFQDIVDFTHIFENVLDLMRLHQIDVNAENVKLCMSASDVVFSLIEYERDHVPFNRDLCDKALSALKELSSHQEIKEDHENAPEPGVFSDEESHLHDISHRPASIIGWRISFKPKRLFYFSAQEPLLLIRQLEKLGSLSVQAQPNDNLPSLEELDPFEPLFSWHFTLHSTCTLEAVEEVFEFVEVSCLLNIKPLIEEASQEKETPLDKNISHEEVDISDFLADLEGFVEFGEDRDHCVQESTISHENDLLDVPELKCDIGHHEKNIAPLPLEEHVTHPVKTSSSLHQNSMRVDLDKVERVVDMVGEIVITQSMINQHIDDEMRLHYEGLVNGVNMLAQHTRTLQDYVMAMRAQPVKSVFARIPRLVRDLSEQMGKDISLEMLGENTEIDKTVIEHLADPLIHMVRNSVDHGIEDAETRVAKSKPVQGKITLSAEQIGSQILVSVSDDGGGIDRHALYQKALEKGIISTKQKLSDEQIDELIFAPGFSTASEISDVSGRGVGMDVVRQNINRLGGRVHISSEYGVGTTIEIYLPLSLAVMDVMRVRLGASQYVIPLNMIIESLQLSKTIIETLPGGKRVMRLRDDYVPVMDLNVVFGVPSDQKEDERFLIICEGNHNDKVGVIVDSILGQQQVVIKNLEDNFERLEGISGATILGDGHVALILDIAGLHFLNTHTVSSEHAA